MFYKSSLIGNGILCDGLFQILLQSNVSYNVMHDQENVGIKCSVMNENSSMLWHRRLGHISIKRIEKLGKDRILVSLDFTDFQTCVDCIKGKHTNKTKKGARKSSNLLEIIHTDICSSEMGSLVRNTSSPLLMIIHILCISICLIIRMKH